MMTPRVRRSADPVAVEDPAIPGLRRALDPRWMAAVLAEGLEPPEGVRIGGCEFERFRHRPGVRAIVLYRVTWTRRGSRAENTTFVHGSLYPGGKSRRVYRRARAEARARGVLRTSTFRAVGHVPETGMVLQAFPFDRRIPGLAPVVAGAPESLRDAIARDVGAPRVTHLVPREIARYRPGVGAVLRVPAFDAPESVAGSFFLKVYRTEHGARTSDTLDRLGRYCDSRACGFDVARAIGYDPRFRTLAVRGAPGRSLEHVLSESGDVDAAFRVAARSLAAFHRSDAPLDRHRTAADDVARARRAAEFLGNLEPAVAGITRELADRIERTIVAGIARPTHYDLKTDHVFVGRGPTTLIDMDSAAYGDPAHDVATLLTRLRVAPRTTGAPADRSRLAAATFLDAYASRAWPGSLGRLGPAFGCAALKVALYFAKRLDHDFASIAEELARDALRVLDDRPELGLATILETCGERV